MKKKKTVVAPDDGSTVEIIASEIKRISAGIKAIRKGPLNDRAIILLIAQACGTTPDTMSQATVRRVLDAMGDLERLYIREPK